MGVCTQIARKYLFFDVKTRAMIYLLIVTALSVLADRIPLPINFYFVKKDNIFNTYGTKFGWGWTLLLACPFIFLTSYLHHRSVSKAVKDLSRMAIATFFWGFITASFVKFEQITGNCHGNEKGASRNDCSDLGGKWIPGFDISGHTFILIYSILVIAEEASAFRNWPSGPARSVQHIPNRQEYENYQKITKVIQTFFIALAILTFVWDFQLLVTILYYHSVGHKITAGLIAFGTWLFTYRLWYPMVFPFSPIRRNAKSS